MIFQPIAQGIQKHKQVNYKVNYEVTFEESHAANFEFISSVPGELR